MHTIKLSDNLLTDKVCESLVELFTNPYSVLRHVDLSQNYLTDQTGVGISNALETNRTIEYLDL